uniref:Phage protein n=1 Tax=Angiostrongylus cantonensis TaxID=6313 RepID=A0A0K0DCA5_ANGCA
MMRLIRSEEIFTIGEAIKTITHEPTEIDGTVTLILLVVPMSSWTNYFDENADASIVVSSEEQFISGVIDGVEWVASSRLGR